MIDTIIRAGADPVIKPLASDGEIRFSAASVLADPTITAMMCPTDLGALDILEELRLRGLAAPEALSVTGYDGIGPLAAPYLGLTTYRQPIEEIGAGAIDLLVEAVENDNTINRSTHTAVKGELILGRTVAPAPMFSS